MPKWEDARASVIGEHLPPVEVCKNLVEVRKGKFRVKETFPTPVDELGLPDADRALALVSSTVEPDYVWPYLTNQHHLCYPRRSYEADSLTHEYREGGAMIRRMPIQQHNLLHQTLIEAPMPAAEVMRERVMEQRNFDTLFRLGRYAIRFERWAEQLRQPEASVGKLAVDDALETSRYYQKMSDVFTERYNSRLDQIPLNGGLTGLLPPPDELQDIREAIPRLGHISAQGFVDVRRASQDRTVFLRAA